MPNLVRMLSLARLVAPMLLLFGVHGAVAQAVAVVPAHPIGLGGPPMPAIVYPDARGHGAQATARRARDGHFYFQAAVNGTSIPVMFDTGATRTVLRSEDAARAGIDVASLNYSGVSETANGRSSFAPVMLGSLTVGDITRHNVPAAVMRPGSLTVTLLGQTFMTQLKGFRVEGEQLILQGE